MLYMRKSLLAVLSLATAILLTACSSSGGTDYGAYDSISSNSSGVKVDSTFGTGLFNSDSGQYDQNENEYTQNEDGYSQNEDDTKSDTKSDEVLLNQINEEKLVYRANLYIETMEFDSALQNLKSKISEHNGFIQNEEFMDGGHWDYYNSYRVNGERDYSLSVRIPTSKYQAFMSDMKGIGNVVRSNSNVENISQTYYNTKAYLESYQNQLEVLMGMYNNASNIADMLTIESRIAEVQAKILSLTTEVQSMDMDVAYSTIDVNLSEVIAYTEKTDPESQRTFFGRISEAFTDSYSNLIEFAQDLAITIIYNMYTIIFIVIMIIVIRSIVKRRKRTPKERKVTNMKNIKHTKLNGSKKDSDKESLEKLMNSLENVEPDSDKKE